MDIDVTGSAYSIAEVGEQLGWLVAALQPSASTTAISASRPRIVSLVERSVVSLSENVAGSYVCKLGCVTDELPLDGPGARQNGQCWYDLFNNPVIVSHYPIPQRSDLEKSIGLEIPLDILIALAETPVFTSFGQNTLMKGYSTMLVPVREVDNIIVWHFIYEESDARLSFLDSKLSELSSIHPIAVDDHRTRHIVGWCSNARSMTGTTQLYIYTTACSLC